MAKKGSVKFNIKKLEVIAASLKKLDDGKYHIQVGIFGDKTIRKKEQMGMTNAEIGFVHEMGSVSRNIPRRSFLLDTFLNHGDKLTLALKPLVEDLYKKGKVDEYLKQAGIAAENLVREAFFTSGWGAWAPLKYATLLSKLKGSLKKRKSLIGQIYAGQVNDKPLIRTGQLWQAIASRTVRA